MLSEGAKGAIGKSLFLSIEKPLLIIGTAAALVIFCLAVTYICARGIRKISVTELMTE